MKTSDGILKGLGRLRSLALFSVAALAALSLSAAAPTAGTQIGNQASATYKDQNGTDRDTTSNTVVTTVLQVPGLTLEQDNTRTVSPGGTVYMPHTLTNTGNGTDSFDLLADNPLGDITFAGLVVYADTNRDGQPDDLTAPITTTGELTSGESFYFVVGTSVPGAVVEGDTGTFDITGTSDFSQSVDWSGSVVDADNTDTVIVSENAVITVTKLIDQAEGIPGTGTAAVPGSTPIRYTLSYNNTGNSAATDVTITDIIPANMTYVTDSGLSSLTGSTVLTDADDGTVTGGGTTVAYDYDNTAIVGDSKGTMTVVIANVPAGASGTVSFEVTIDEGIAPQVILNQAEYTYDPDGPGGEDPEDPIKTNRPPFEVLPTPEVSIGDDSVDDALPGETVVFTNALVNNGNVTDTFDMTIVSHNYPAGTTFVFFQEDENTPMVDTNGNGIVDTGPVAGFGGTYDVVVKAKLPTNIDPADYATPTVPYVMTKRATGEVLDVDGDPATDDGEDTVTSILPPSVDITNAVTGDDPDSGAGDGPNVDGHADYTADPGQTIYIPLTVENEGNIPDAYNLTVEGALPAGWVVNIRKVAGGAVVNNSGPLNPSTDPSDPTLDGGYYQYVAQVIIPAGEEPGANNLTFAATSPTSGAKDTILNVVTVNTIREIGLVTDNAGQVSPGGSVVYEHIISNLGNVTEAELTVSEIGLGLADTKTAEGWTSVVYLDNNDNGVLDASDPIITSLAAGLVTELSPAGQDGDSARLFVKVFAPLGAPNAAINITTITATPSGTIDGIAAPAAVSNEDTTTVILGDVVLLKEQAIDTDGDGVADTAFSVQPQSAQPGQWILYRVTATNTGSADATDLVIYDTTPTATTYSPAIGGLGIAYATSDNTAAAPTIPVAPAATTSGAFEFHVGTLPPGVSAEIGFGVQIND